MSIFKCCFNMRRKKRDEKDLTIEVTCINKINKTKDLSAMAIENSNNGLTESTEIGYGTTADLLKIKGLVIEDIEQRKDNENDIATKLTYVNEKNNIDKTEDYCMIPLENSNNRLTESTEIHYETTTDVLEMKSLVSEDIEQRKHNENDIVTELTNVNEKNNVDKTEDDCMTPIENSNNRLTESTEIGHGTTAHLLKIKPLVIEDIEQRKDNENDIVTELTNVKEKKNIDKTEDDCKTPIENSNNKLTEFKEIDSVTTTDLLEMKSVEMEKNFVNKVPIFDITGTGRDNFNYRHTVDVPFALVNESVPVKFDLYASKLRVDSNSSSSDADNEEEIDNFIQSLPLIPA